MKTMHGDRLYPCAMDDLGEIHAMAEAVKTLGLTEWDTDYPSIEVFTEDIERGELYALRREGQLLAFIAIITDEDDEDAIDLHNAPGVSWSAAKKAAALSRLCVAPQHHDHGIGTLMMGYADGVCAQLGCDMMRLMAAVTNEKANHLYSKLGYRFCGKTFLYDEDFNCYEKPVS